MRRVLRCLAAAGVATGVAAGVVLTIPTAHAHDGHGGEYIGNFDKTNRRFLAGDDTLPPARHNVEAVGKLKLSNVGDGLVADVGVHGNYAYLGKFYSEECASRGVWVVDISDPRNPREVKFLDTGPGSYVGEGVQAIRLETDKFSGDVMVFSSESCGNGGSGGATLVDVTDPRQATPILSNFGDTDPLPGGPGPSVAHNSHSVFLWTDGPKAYAVLVDNTESGADVFDISDPRAPVRIAEYNLPEQFPHILQNPSTFAAHWLFFHDVIVKKINERQIMLASNWDAGYVKLDVTDPANPVYLGDSDYAEFDPELFRQRQSKHQPEGNAHQAEFTADNSYILGADEDFAPGTASLTIGEQTITGSALGIMSDVDIDAAVPVYVGDACPDHPVPPAPAGSETSVAVMEDGTCDLQVKHDAVANAGYRAAVLTAGLNCTWGEYKLSGPRIAIGDLYSQRKEIFSRLFDYDTSKEVGPDCEAGEPAVLADVKPGTVGKAFGFKAWFDGWGYLHLFSNNDGKLRELDTYAIPEAMNPEHSGAEVGALSVHEVASSPTRPELAYVAYYGGGLRVMSVAGGKICEVGRFIDDRGNDLWGVQVFNQGRQEFVAASDRSYGLYIFKYTGR